jgi:hypothetical protein
MTKTKSGALILAGLIATYSVCNPLIEERRAPMLWPALQAVLAAASGIALYCDSVVLAAVCALLLLGVSLITFFGAGFHVVIPAAGLVFLIALHSQRADLPRRL